jgi:3-oxoacyl-(acyl-carrier-protein) synthase
MELAILMMQHNTFMEFLCEAQKQTKPIRKVLINAVGFGGNAVSVLLSL